MMKKFFLAFALSVLLACIAGCSSVEYSKGGDTEFHPGHPGHEIHNQ